MKKLILFLGIILITAGCIKAPEEAKLTKLNIAFPEWVGYGLFYLAQEKGFLKEEGVELVFIDEQLDSARREAFKEGTLDCEAGTLDLLISKRAMGAPVVAVMELDHSYGADGIVAVKEIQKLGDIIGKRVAFARDDVGEAFISCLFDQAGISIDKVVIVPVAPGEAFQLFLEQKADAVVTWEPFLSKALERPGAHILFSSKDKPGLIIDTLNIREDIVKNKPQVVKGLMRSWFKGLKYFQDHPVEASEIIAKYYNLTAKQYGDSVQKLRWEDHALQLEHFTPGGLAAVFNVIVESKIRNKRISQKPDILSSINTELLKALYENSQ